MKNLLALAFLVIATNSYAVNIDAGNNMAQEPAPSKETSRTGNYNSSRTTYGSEMNNDTISTGQSSTSRNSSVETPAARPAPERCIDRSGYSYSRNDSGYAACVNQQPGAFRNR